MDALRLLSRSTGLKLRLSENEPRRPLPSSQENGPLLPADQSRKRKRDAVDGLPGTVSDMSHEECRRILKRNKVKVTDLRILQDISPVMSKKAHKEAAQMYPQPLTTFSDLRTQYDVSKSLTENVAVEGYVDPTAVQLAALPLLLGSDEPDLLTVAPTGSGKTLAFLIPLVQKIWSVKKRDESERCVRAIIVAPTKELARQIVNEGRKLTARTGVRISEMRKGMRLQGEDAMDLDFKPDADDKDSESASEDEDGEASSKTAAAVVKSDILVTTPLLLVNAITVIPASDPETQPKTQTLPNITTLILDEADVLLDPLFRTQTLTIWSACTSPNLRVSLWSATIGSNIESLALNTISARRNTLDEDIPSAPLLRVVIGLKDSALPPTITHKLIYAATEQGKLLGLRNLIRPPPSLTISTQKPPPLRPPFLIFTQTIVRATALHKELLYDIPDPTRTAVLHSNLSSTARQSTMSRFRTGQVWILITTDLLSRGVDFAGVNVVVNYDIPSTAAAYVHRAGRTGRAGREGGICVTLYTKEDIKYVKNIANVIAASQKGASEKQEDIPSWMMHALPSVSRKDRQELKVRGVDVRRGEREGDDEEEKRKKMKARIGVVSGFDRRREERRKGAMEGSKRRKRKELERGRLEDEGGGGEGEWSGFGD